MGFPVLNLPSLVFDNVYRFLNVPDKILFSQCSKSMFSIVKFKEDPKKDYHLNITISDEKTNVCLGMWKNTWPGTLFFWHLDTTWDPDKVITRRIDERKWESVVKRIFYERKLFEIIEMLRDLFNCPLREVCYTKKRTNFKKLFVNTDALHCADRIEICKGTFKREEIDFMLDHFNTNYLEFVPDFGPGYRYDKPISFSRTYLHNARWVDFDRLLEIAKNVCTLVLENTKRITDKDINELIKWWLGSDNKKLELVFVDRKYGHWDRSAIMEGIASTPGRRKRRKAIPLCIHWIDEFYKDGLDISREKDGVQATVIADGSFFALGILQVPNPNLEEGEEDDEDDF